MKFFKLKSLIAFLIPFTLLVLTFSFFDIGPNLTYDTMLIDAYQQYISFNHELVRMIKELDWQSFLYNWNIGTGVNFLGTFAYYLSSPLSILFLFFDESRLNDAFYFITLIKISLSGATMYYLLTNRHKEENYYTLFFSTAYALMSYNLLYHFNLMWLDAVYMFPLILKGIHDLIENKKTNILFFSLLYTFLSNFYISFMIGIGSVIYLFLITMFQESYGFKFFFKKLIALGLRALLAILCLSFLILPTFINILSSSQNIEYTPCLISVYTDVMFKFFIGANDGVSNTATPNLYIGLLPLFFALYYFFFAKRKTQIVLTLTTLFFFTSFTFAPLIKFWHAFKYPTWFPGRFSFIFSCFIILIAYRGFLLFIKHENERYWKRSFIKTISFATLFVSLLFTAFMLLLGYKTYLPLDQIIPLKTLVLNALFLMVYFTLFILHQNYRGFIYIPLLFTFFLFELGVNASINFNRLNELYIYQPHDVYQLLMNRKTIYDEAFDEKPVDRTQTYEQIVLNENLFYGTKGLSNFNTLSYNKLNSLLRRMTNYDYELDTHLFEYNFYSPIIHHLFNVKYSGLPLNLLGDDYTPLTNYFNVNEDVLSIGYMVSDKILQPIEWSENPLKYQEDFLNALIDETYELTEEIDYEVFNLHNFKLEDEKYQREDKEQESSLSIRALIKDPNRPIYLQLNNYYRNNYGNLELSTNYHPELITQSSDSLKNLYLGKVNSDNPLEISLKLNTELKEIFFEMPKLYYFDQLKFEEIIKDLKENELKNVRITGNKLSADLTTDHPGVLMLTIPYDKGWTVKVDGKKVESLALQDTLLGIEVSEGVHQIELEYTPLGFKTGVILSLISFSGIFIHYRLNKKRNI